MRFGLARRRFWGALTRAVEILNLNARLASGVARVRARARELPTRQGREALTRPPGRPCTSCRRPALPIVRIVRS